MARIDGNHMVWAIIDERGIAQTETFADDPYAAWHRYVQIEHAVNREDAVTKVLVAMEHGWTCERLLVEDAHARLTDTIRLVR